MYKKGQMGFGLIFGLVILVVTVIVFANLVSPMKGAFDTARHQDSLNCVQTAVSSLCNNSASVPCYNSSISTETLACVFIDLALPLIIIFVILAMIGMLLAGKSMMAPEPQYYEGY